MRINRNKKPVLDFGLLGKVAIGEKSDKGFPKSIDYFRFRPTQIGGNSKAVLLAEQLFPHSSNNPRNLLHICFSSDSHDNCSHFYELRDLSGSLVARTDYNTIEIEKTDRWNKWYKENAQKVQTKQTKPGKYIFTDGLEFGEGTIFGDMLEFTKKMEERLQHYAIQQRKTEKQVANLIFKERLILRFVLVNFPIVGRWEFSTKGKASTIKELLNAYDAVQHARGTIVGTQFALKIDKVKSEKKGKVYPVVTMAPTLTAMEVNSGNLLINSVNMHTNGLRLQSGETSDSEGVVDTDFDEV